VGASGGELIRPAKRTPEVQGAARRATASNSSGVLRRGNEPPKPACADQRSLPQSTVPQCRRDDRKPTHLMVRRCRERTRQGEGLQEALEIAKRLGL